MEPTEGTYARRLVYEDRDLANTLFDCLHCHQPDGPQSRKLLRMQERRLPWTHWFRNNKNEPGGETLAKPLSECKYFPRDVVEMVSVAEESNTLEKVLIDIANGLEKRTARQLEMFVKLLEPVMLLVMAAVTLVVVAGLLLPVFKMGSTVRG